MTSKGIYQNNIDIEKANERKQMMKEVLDKLWSGAKVNNKLDGYWYVRLSDVSKALEEYKEETFKEWLVKERENETPDTR